ncbi:SUN domain-containing ossification factor isoform X2 [Bemisia tabaci]|uniref:SUN domain-containing ossification factor isoform X2 n=1 Tax=Bemisia tabaci TaxID=7038 RepID=UPI0008F993F2|nr:PREDICTED: SUN domain-containing ossification factor isoform X2 [Bemisia tabaci]XP_018895717.1 PREDICTED: SUN domain-containing ossification factor isoform X2 [Bemisia tabaci]
MVIWWQLYSNPCSFQPKPMFVFTTTLFFAVLSFYLRITETGEAGVVFTLVDSTTAELQKHANIVAPTLRIPLQNASLFNGTPLSGPTSNGSQDHQGHPVQRPVYVVRAEPKVVSKHAVPEVPEPEPEKNDTGPGVAPPVPDKPSPPAPPAGDHDNVIIVPQVEPAAAQSHEDIPSFNEWAQKQLAEAEKKKGENGTLPPATNVGVRKLRSKNYASPDCGAKVVAANPEAKSPGLVLSPSRDEYLLNTCNSRIWFVVELCEAIQAKKVELANFELFSSSPKNFSVSVSDRFPTRDWTLVGHLTAKDERVVQSFNLQHFQFAKYVRVELHSHYGAEHFCPISLFRVYGTSEIEVLDTVDEPQIVAIADDDDDEDGEKTSEEPSEENDGKNGSKNLFGTARDAVMSIVKKAAQALGSTSQNREGLPMNMTHPRPFSHTCTTPSHIIVCDNCTEQLFNRVYNLISCNGKALDDLISSSLIYNTLTYSDVCKDYGLDFSSLRSRISDFELRDKESYLSNISSYLSIMLPNHYLAAACNFVAVKEKKVVLNVSDEYVLKVIASQQPEGCTTKDELEVMLPELASTCSVDEPQKASSSAIVQPELPQAQPDVLQSTAEVNPSLVAQIKPTKTQSNEVELSSQNKSDAGSKEEMAMEASVIVSKPREAENQSDPSTLPKTSAELEMEENIANSTDRSAETMEEPIESIDSETYDKLFSDLDEPEEASASALPSEPPPVQKESVFVRLANRIKALERNMSLSGQYLEELSRRYKKQVEEMQRALTASIEERRRVEEKEYHQSLQLEILTNRVDALTESVKTLLEERNSWTYKASMIGQHSVLIFVEVAIFIGFLLLCRWIPEVEVSKRKISVGLRRNQSYHVRRKSFDSIATSSHVRKRRPSEEALRIAGTAHQDLLISETSQNQVMKTEVKKRRRKKRDLAKSASSSSILTSAVSTPPTAVKSGPDQIFGNKSAPADYGVRWHDQTPWQNEYPPSALSAAEQDITPVGHRQLVSPIFIKTALSSRNQRTSQISISDPAPTNGAQSSESELTPSHSNVSDSQSSNSTPIKDRKKTVGFKKIVRKFF